MLDNVGNVGIFVLKIDFSAGDKEFIGTFLHKMDGYQKISFTGPMRTPALLNLQFDSILIFIDSEE